MKGLIFISFIFFLPLVIFTQDDPVKNPHVKYSVEEFENE